MRLRRPALVAPPAAAAIRRFQAGLFPFFDLEEAPAPAAARLRAFGGRLFADAPRLVRAVARGLGRAGRLFPDVPFSGAALAARQERADAWRTLRDSLRCLAEHANARYLEEQAGAVDDALDVLRQQAGAARMPFAPADLAARRAALGEAEAIFSRYQALKRRQARAGLKRARAVAEIPERAADRADRSLATGKNPLP